MREEAEDYFYAWSVDQQQQQQQQQQSDSSSGRQNADERQSGPLNDPTPTVQGVFCGYTVTENEYNRLKSAHPDD